MRNTKLEEKYINRVFLLAGLGIVLGFLALAIGTELWVLSFLPEEPVLFWIWQGIWAIVFSIIISLLARTAQRG